MVMKPVAELETGSHKSAYTKERWEVLLTIDNSQALLPAMAMAASYAPGVAMSAVVAVIGCIAAPYVARSPRGHANVEGR